MRKYSQDELKPEIILMNVKPAEASRQCPHPLHLVNNLL